MPDTPLAARLRAARKALHPPVTQREVAKRLNLTPGAVNLWEAGKTEPGAGDLVELAKWFGVSVDWLLGLESAQPRQVINKKSPPLYLVPVLEASAISKWHWDAVAEVLQTAVMYPQGTAAAMRVHSESLNSTCPDGSYVVISKADDAKPGDVVLASVDRRGRASTDPVLRKYIKEGRDTLLVADDTRFPTYKLSDGARIIGRVVEVVVRRLIH